MNAANNCDYQYPTQTATDFVGTTAVLQSIGPIPDGQEIIWLVPVTAITGSPQLIVENSVDGATWVTEQTYTRSSADNGKTLVVNINRPMKLYYRLKLNLNSGTMSIRNATNGVHAYLKGLRVQPLAATTQVNLTSVGQ